MNVVLLALVMTDDRHLTVRTYNEGLADTIYRWFSEHSGLMDRWLKDME